MFRDDLAAAHARIEALELENRELRAEIDRLTGRVRAPAPQPDVRTLGEWPIWVGARIFAWDFPRALYAGETTYDKSILRSANLVRGTVTDLELAPKSGGFVARIGDRVIAQLADLRLVAIPVDGGDVASLQLAEPLIARPFVVDDRLACVTAASELVHIDPIEWRVTASEPYRESAHPLDGGHPDRCRDRNDYAFEDDAGWKLQAVLEDGDELVLALERNLGNTEMAIGRAPKPKPKPATRRRSEYERPALAATWITRIGFGDPHRFYLVDGLTMLHGHSIPKEMAGAVDRAGVLQFRVEDVLSKARLHLADGSVHAI